MFKLCLILCFLMFKEIKPKGLSLLIFCAFFFIVYFLYPNPTVYICYHTWYFVRLSQNLNTLGHMESIWFFLTNESDERYSQVLTQVIQSVKCNWQILYLISEKHRKQRHKKLVLIQWERGCFIHRICNNVKLMWLKIEHTSCKSVAAIPTGEKKIK